MSVNHSARTGLRRQNGDISSLFFNMKIYCVLSLELPHQDDSNEFSNYAIFNIKKKFTLNYPKYAALGLFPKDSRPVVNEPSVFSPSKFYCTYTFTIISDSNWPGRVAQSVGHLTRKSGVLGSIPGLATYFRFSFCFFKKGSCQLLAKVCARSTG